MKSEANQVDQTSREKLMKSAEHLFAERGYDGVSVRDIANDAGVNSALVGYYFGGKEGLLAEVYTQRCGLLRDERARLLAEYSAGGKTPSLEEVLDAFITPSLESARNGEGRRSLPHIRSILAAENSSLLEKLVAENFDESSKIFVKALGKCLPQLTHEDVLWRFHFLLGTIYYTATGPHRIKALSRGRCDPSDPAATKEELIPFLVAGFTAPSAAKGNKRRGRGRGNGTVKS